jgi:hypothetical protein
MIEIRLAARSPRIARSALLATLLALTPLHASDPIGGSGPPIDFEPEVRPWQEEPTVLPPWPQEEDLLPVPLPPRDTLRLYLDTRHLARGETDGVVRFTLIVETPGGARNVFFEGIRCDTRQYKTYAVGGGDSGEGRRWLRLADSSWQRIPYFEVDAFRYHLYRFVFCDRQGSPRTPREIRHVLRAEPPE